MRIRLLPLICALALLACSLEYGPQGDLHGRLVGGPVNPSPDRIAIVWNNWDMKEDGDQWATVQEGTLRPDGLGFHFDFAEAPPDSAMQTSNRFEGLGGQSARGTVVAYRDVNGNGSLDLIPDGGSPVDTIVGVSAPFYGPYEEAERDSYEVIYVEAPAPERPLGLQPGYNLVHNGEGVVPLNSEVKVELSVAPVHNLYVCESVNPRNWTLLAFNHCLGEGPLRVSGYLDRYYGMDSAYVQLFSEAGEHTDAEVRVNGLVIPYDADLHAYRWEEAAGTLLQAGANNLIEVSGPNLTTTSWSIRLDNEPILTQPEQGSLWRWDQPIPVSWSEDPMVSRYLVQQQVRFPEGSRGRGYLGEGGSFTFPGLLQQPAEDLTSYVFVMSLRGFNDDNGTEIQSAAYSFRDVTITR